MSITDSLPESVVAEKDEGWDLKANSDPPWVNDIVGEDPETALTLYKDPLPVGAVVKEDLEWILKDNFRLTSAELFWLKKT